MEALSPRTIRLSQVLLWACACYGAWLGYQAFWSVSGVVGIAAWCFPNVAIIDEFGLNDHVIARTPAISSTGAERLMAHDRQPPEGYVDCFEPNVMLDNGQTYRRELTDKDIVACETRFAKK